MLSKELTLQIRKMVIEFAKTVCMLQWMYYLLSVGDALKTNCLLALKLSCIGFVWLNEKELNASLHLISLF